ncbi:hypothetical protein C9374_012551 [Naegleria lovaniensis]|uniref:AP-3 complex subunit delta n=1 Tax=Naegleria lovaniensis TaxID=51637 RepID=A0AA88H269_NAELO|nr:uncharacterized protein C9374_012551 [Naegleria lovaniensis]KAG2392299.1 hypothetical protein C9374_012551 [Naegleria lovaniensis]
MFEKSLQDMVKGIRANKNNEDAYIRSCIAEIKEELRSNDIKKKAVGVQKVTYLHMLGYDMNWAAFHILEVMSSPIFTYKRIGYLAASLGFTPQTDVILLTHQLFRKELKSLNQYDTGLAVSAIANIATPDLAKDLASEILALLNSSRQYIRKKAVLCMYKIFIQYPDALRPSFPRLKEKLSDSHPSVVSAAVNVICELARRNPHNYLGMAPIFYKLLTNVNNNWTLIKIVKLMGALAPHEPRLAKKLVEPIANMISTTPAKSLLYECLVTVTVGMKEHMTVVKLAVDKLKQFVEDKDQNLKYLGLAGLNNLLSKYPKVISDMKDTIMECLEDQDITIRFRALDLLCGVVNQKNIKGIMSRLMKQLEKAEGDYRDFLIERIITSCSKDNYSSIANFKWYLDILIHLTNVKSAQHGKLIAQHIMDVLIRVKSLRQHGVNEMINLLTSPHLLTESSETSSVFDVLYAASWTIGEFITQADVDYKDVLEKLLQPQTASLPDRIKACYVQAITKIYAAAAAKGQTKSTEQQVQDLLGFDSSTLESQHQEGENEQLENLPKQNNTKVDSELLSQLRTIIRDGFNKYFTSPDVEIQERCSTCLALLDIHEQLTKEGTDVGPEIESIFEDPLNPVLPGSQEKVPIPEGLDLDNWIGRSWELLVDESVFNQVPGLPSSEYTSSNPFESENVHEGHEISDPNAPISNYQQYKEVFTIKSSKKKVQPTTPEAVPKKKTVKKTVKKKVKKPQEEEDEEPMQVSTEFEQVEGYIPTKATKIVEVEDALSKIDLTQPIGADEQLPTIKAYPIGSSPIIPKKKEEPAKKKVVKEAKAETTKTKKKATTKEAATSSTKKKTKTVKQSSGKQLLDLLDEPTQPAEEKKATKKKATTTKKAPEKKTSTGKKGLKLLCRDDHLKVYYNTKAFPLDANSLSIPISLENISDEDVNAIAYNIDSTMNLKFVRPGIQQTGAVRCGFSLSPESTNTLNPSFTCQSFVRQQQITGYIEYVLGTEDKHRLDFTMKIPSSMFFIQKRIAVDEFANLMKTNQLPYLSSTNCTLNEKIGDVNTAAKEIARQLRLTVVDSVPDQVYQMYGCSCQGHHLAVLVKAKSATTVSVELKTTDDTLSTSLIQEVALLFKEK